MCIVTVVRHCNRAIIDMMMASIVIVLFFVSSVSVLATRQSTKKQGFSGYLGLYYTCDDAKALHLGSSWYYTWLHEPVQGGASSSRCASFPPPGEFVPMIIDRGIAKELQTKATTKVWRESRARFLLGYNEPDYGNGHNHPHAMNPRDAAMDWSHVQDLARSNNLTLVSPAISTTGLNDDGVSKWLDEFFANCSTIDTCDPSLIEHIAFHDYGGDPDVIVKRANGLYRRYKRTVWITEFAINKWSAGYPPTREQQDAYMRKVLSMLDESEAIYRYAWYTARDQPSAADAPGGGGNLLKWNVTDPTLTSTGYIYAEHSKKFD